MTLTGLVAERQAKGRPNWVAIWRTPAGNFIHQVLPVGVPLLGAGGDPEPAARAYALTNQPEWNAR